MRKFLVLIFLLTGLYTSKSYDSTTTFNYGINAGAGLIFDNSNYENIQSLWGFSNASEYFKSGSGLNYEFGVLFGIKLSNEIFLDIKSNLYIYNISYSDLSKSYSYFNDRINDVDSSFIIRQFDYSSQQIRINPSLIFTIFKPILLRLGLNTFYLLNLSGNNKVVSLESFKLNESNTASIDLPNYSKLQYGLNLGFGYSIPLNTKGSILLIPELNFSYNLSKLFDNESPQRFALGLTTSLVFNNQKECPSGMEKWKDECVPECENGKVRNMVSGICECPPGFIDDGNGNCKKEVIEPILAADEFKCGNGEIKKLTLPGNKVLNKETCEYECASGFVECQNGDCIKEDNRPNKIFSAAKCEFVCADGYEPDNNGNCIKKVVAPVVAADEFLCKNGEIKKLTLPGNKVLNKQTCEYECASGFVECQNGDCIKEDNRPNKIFSAANCEFVCADGYEPDNNGNCVKKVVAPVVAADEFLCKNGEIKKLTLPGNKVLNKQTCEYECASGFVECQNGDCIKEDNRPNKIFSAANCEFVCADGYEPDNNGNCVKKVVAPVVAADEFLCKNGEIKKLTLPGNKILNKQTCEYECASGFVECQNGDCIKEDNRPNKIFSAAKCEFVCADGYEPDNNGNCIKKVVAPIVAADEFLCKNGEVMKLTLPGNKILNKETCEYECASGFVECQNGDCIKEDNRPNKIFSAAKCEFVCRDGYLECQDGSCKPATNGIKKLNILTCKYECPPDYIECTTGDCIKKDFGQNKIFKPEICSYDCEEGFIKDKNGNCVPIKEEPIAVTRPELISDASVSNRNVTTLVDTTNYSLTSSLGKIYLAGSLTEYSDFKGIRNIDTLGKTNTEDMIIAYLNVDNAKSGGSYRVVGLPIFKDPEQDFIEQTVSDNGDVFVFGSFKPVLDARSGKSKSTKTLYDAVAKDYKKHDLFILRSYNQDLKDVFDKVIFAINKDNNLSLNEMKYKNSLVYLSLKYNSSVSIIQNPSSPEILKVEKGKNNAAILRLKIEESNFDLGATRNILFDSDNLIEVKSFAIGKDDNITGIIEYQDSCRYDSKNKLVDPTFEGYIEGSTLDKIRNLIISINKNNSISWYIQPKIENYSPIIQGRPFRVKGFFRSKSIVNDNFGNVYVTGEYRGKISFNNYSDTLISGNTKQFIMKIDSKGKIININESEGDYENLTSELIYIGKDGGIFIAGKIGGNEIKYKKSNGKEEIGKIAQKENAFISKFDTDLNCIWFEQFKSIESSEIKQIKSFDNYKAFFIGEFNKSSYPFIEFKQSFIDLQTDKPGKYIVTFFIKEKPAGK